MPVAPPMRVRPLAADAFVDFTQRLEAAQCGHTWSMRVSAWHSPGGEAHCFLKRQHCRLR